MKAAQPTPCILVADDQPPDLGVRVAQKRRDVLRRAPADAADGDAKRSIGDGHFGVL